MIPGTMTNDELQTAIFRGSDRVNPSSLLQSFTLANCFWKNSSISAFTFRPFASGVKT